MQVSEVLQAWGRILGGRSPVLSIEITRECPLRCPGCYAYEDDHLGQGNVTLRQLSDYKGSDLVRNILRVVEKHRPLHVSLVGGDPLVRYRELQELLPELDRRGIYVQVVTSAFRTIPVEWNALSRLSVVVSIDGLQPEHDARRKPATYERILKSIQGSQVKVHCTITGQMTEREDYLEEFVAFWNQRPEVKRIWFSLFTPQKGATGPEILTPDKRAMVIRELGRLREIYPIIQLNKRMLEELAHPPQSPADCIFARTTTSISADLKTRITPCQFGGDPDCSQCGCMATMGMAAVGHYRLLPGVTAGDIFKVSELIGKGVNRLRGSEPEAGEIRKTNPAAKKQVA
jgi:MoaA/NifB/PqqE/SkfB family radical SAM enzyme